MSKFKIGDKVRMLNEWSYFAPECVGKVGIITKLCYNHYLIDNIEGLNFIQTLTFGKESLVELVEDSAILLEEPHPCPKPVQHSRLVLGIREGTKLLEGEFKAENGELYEVIVRKV